MRVGEIWIEKDPEDPDNPEAIELKIYVNPDHWVIDIGEMEDGMFISAAGPFVILSKDEIDDDEFKEMYENSEFLMSGEEIYDQYVLLEIN
jgi:hypothetical protein